MTIFSGLILFKNEDSLFKRKVQNYQELNNGEIKNKTKFAEDMGIKKNNFKLHLYQFAYVVILPELSLFTFP